MTIMPRVLENFAKFLDIMFDERDIKNIFDRNRHLAPPRRQRLLERKGRIRF